jgi:PAS domain S-box-containing protein
VQFALSEMPVPLVFATHRIIRDCNAAFANLFGVSVRDLTNQSFSKLYPELSDFIRTGELWRTHMTDGKIYYDERIMADIDGNRFWCKVNGRSRNIIDPFADAMYCFQPMNRPITNDLEVLTARQQQVLSMIAQGKTNSEIAAEMKLSRRTVESHRARMMRAAGMRNSAELVAWFSAKPNA